MLGSAYQFYYTTQNTGMLTPQAPKKADTIYACKIKKKIV